MRSSSISRAALIAYLYCFSFIPNYKKRHSIMRLMEILGATALLASQATATIYYAGVAESGGEFGVYSKSSLV